MEIFSRRSVNTIPAFKYSFPNDEIDTVVAEFKEMLRSGDFLTSARHTSSFEEAFARLAGTNHAAAVSSGTAALEIILRWVGVEGQEVIVPTNTFAATPFAVIHAGGHPVFADCLDDLTIDPEDVARRVTGRTVAVITVHVGGLVSPHTHSLVQTCTELGLPLIEDAAHAHGSALQGQKAGSFGIGAAFSFFSTKVMTTGEGGMITTNDSGLHRTALLLRDHAKVDGRNWHEQVGHNWRLTEMQALLGLSQLRTLADSIVRRQEIARLYDNVLSGSQCLRPLIVPGACHHNFYKYVVFCQSSEVAANLGKSLRECYGIHMGGPVYDTPCHLQPVFRPFYCPLPTAERLCPSHVCPPIYPALSDEDAIRVASAFLELAG